jgi:hypothetical protein
MASQGQTSKERAFSVKRANAQQIHLSAFHRLSLVPLNLHYYERARKLEDCCPKTTQQAKTKREELIMVT